MAGDTSSCCAPKCDKVDNSRMVSCDRCKRWWHFSCADFDPQMYDTATPWFCNDSQCVKTLVAGDSCAGGQSEEDPTTLIASDQHDLVSSFDQLMEAAVVAQASSVEKDLKIKSLSKQLEELKLKMSVASVSAKQSPPTMDRRPSPPVQPRVKLSADRIQMLKNIQANHKLILKGLEELKTDYAKPEDQLESTHLPGTSNRRASFADSSIQHSEMSSLLTILNRNNVQELPSFSGANKREWLYFEEVFKSTTIEGKYNNKENVARLRKALTGEAYQLVSDRLKYSSDDIAIMDALRAIFGRPEVLVHGLTSDLLKLPALKSRSDPNLSIWAVRINGFVADIKSMNKDEELFNGYVLTDLAGKLGAGLYQEWRRLEAAVPRASLKDLADFVAAKVVDLPPDLLKPLEIVTTKNPAPQRSQRQVFTHQQEAVPEVHSVCCKCGHQQHPLWKCAEFRALTPKMRMDLVREKSICFSCLDPIKHDWRACSKKGHCGLDNCTGRHHQLLHAMFGKRNKELNTNAVPFIPQKKFVSSHPNTDVPVLYKIAPIRIYGKHNKCIDTYALLDDGSSITMVERDLFNEMNLEGTPEVLTVNWTKGMSWSEEAIRTNLSISGVRSRRRHDLKGVYCVGDLGLPSQTVDVSQLKKLYPHLRGLPLTNLDNAKPKILIGLNQAKFLLGTRQRHGKEEQPIALKTLLGWIVFGQSSHNVNALSLIRAAKPTVRLLFHDAIKAEPDLHELVRYHFSTEEFGVKPPNGDFISREDSRALDIMERSLKVTKNRYEIGLLWKSDDVKLPNSYPLALRRLISLERSLKNKPDLLKWKNEYIQQLVAKGYARVASVAELEKDWPRVWYAPTFVVQNPNKLPPKPRLVVDVAAKIDVRVGEILDSSTPRQWFYIKSIDNVVDDGTRCSETTTRTHDSRWFQGPHFLKHPFAEWPITPGKADESELYEEQERRLMTHKRRVRVSYSIYEVIAPRFRARWTSLVHVIAYLLRFKEICKKNEEKRQAFISPIEFQRAEDWLYRKIQQDVFQTEITLLEETNRVASSSAIYGLSPFLDSEGTVRMSSRAQKALTSYAARNPAILPKKHELVDLLVQHYHEQNFHVGSALTISDIRERVWIISIRSVVEKTKTRCNMCKRLRARPIMPMMGQLPRSRLAFDSKPFSHVGVDCFGPLFVKYGRGTVKRYGMIFTCLTFRAVQIELLKDLGLDQCTMGLRRFLVNRVVTRYLYSDNGSNFVGSNNLLQKDIGELENKLSERAARYEGIVWRFIPAYSPWMGGAWERLIKSIKITLNFILRGVVPHEDVLRNALVEAQGQINRRPLTHIPVDPEDPRPLTPNSIIFGEDDKDVTAPGILTERDALSRLYSRRSQHLMREFTRRWYKEYLPEITRRSKWHRITKAVAVGDIVLVIEPNEIQSVWKLGRIVAVYPGGDDIIRTADVRLSSGILMKKRAVGRLAVLDLESSSEDSDGLGSVIEPSS